MSIYHSLFRPEELDSHQLVSLHDHLNYIARMEVHRIAADEADHAAARRLDATHLDLQIAEEGKARDRVLRLSWSYSIAIRRKLREGQEVDRRIICKEDSFSDTQVARMLNTLSECMRHALADDLAMALLEDFYDKEAHDHGPNDVWTDSLEEIIEAVDSLYPGQLETLYRRIQTGTLGK